MSQPTSVVPAMPSDGKSNPSSPAEITVKDAIPVDSAELVPVNLAVEAVTLDTLMERVNLIKAAMKRCMQENQHYGTIPGTKKPSLWKPGAELICTLFQLGTRYPNHANQVVREEGHFIFTLTCELFHIPTGRVIGEGVGAAATMEYRYRIQTEERIYPNGNTVPAKYTPMDFYNTCLKIGKKRAMVDAVLTVTGASEIFTQDLEDLPEEILANKPERTGNWSQKPDRRPLPKRPISTTATAGNGNGHTAPAAASTPGTLEKLEGILEKAFPNDYQGTRYYCGRLNGGRQLQCTDATLGSELLSAIGQRILAVAEPSPKPGKWYVKSFTYPDFEEQPAAPLRTAREEVYRALLHADLSEVQVLKAARKLGVVETNAPTLAGLCKPVFEAILDRWPEVETLAKKEDS
jgi:hypothetical protein